MMKIRTTFAVLALSTLPLSFAVASERQSQAINMCIEKAHENYQESQGSARFWQLSQVGRYIRVWLKVRTADEGNSKALCKVHTRHLEVTEFKRLER